MSLFNLVNWAMPPEDDKEKKSACDCGGKKKAGTCASSCGCKDNTNGDGKSGPCGAKGSCSAEKNTSKAAKKGPCSPGSCSPGSCVGAPKKGDGDNIKTEKKIKFFISSIR